jgi:hypothetical protein
MGFGAVAAAIGLAPIISAIFSAISLLPDQ